MSRYSDIRSQIEVNTDANLTKRYLQLWRLLHGNTSVETEDLEEVQLHFSHHRRRRRTKSSYPSKEGLSKVLSESKTLISTNGTEARKDKNRAESAKENGQENCANDRVEIAGREKQQESANEEKCRANFEKWLQKKTVLQREARKQAKLEKVQKKLTEAQELQEKKEREKESEIAYVEWLNNKLMEATQQVNKSKESSKSNSNSARSNSASNQDHHPVNSEEKKNEENSDRPTEAEFGSLSNNNVHSVPNQADVKPNEEKQQKLSDKTFSSSTQARVPLPKASAEPLASKFSKQRLTNQTSFSGSNSALAKDNNVKVSTESPANEKSELKKKITYDEWLKEKEALQKATVQQEKEREELRQSLRNMSEMNIPARQRVQKIIEGANDDKAFIPDKEKTQEKPRATSAQESKRISDETLRRMAAATHEWPKKYTEQQKNRGCSGMWSNHTSKPADSSKKSADCEVKPEGSGTTNNDNNEVHGTVTASLENTSIDNSGVVFALTEVSGSLN